MVIKIFLTLVKRVAGKSLTIEENGYFCQLVWRNLPSYFGRLWRGWREERVIIWCQSGSVQTGQRELVDNSQLETFLSSPLHTPLSGTSLPSCISAGHEVKIFHYIFIETDLTVVNINKTDFRGFQNGFVLREYLIISRQYDRKYSRHR